MSEEIRFDGDVVVVTGGAGGIGRSQAIELGRRGARVVVNDLGGSPRGGGSDATMAQAVVDEIVSAGGDAVASGASVASDDGPQQIVGAALDTWGRIDGLIHNAAIVLDDHVEDVTDDDLDSIMAVNLRGTFRTVRAVYRAMKDTGGGRIVTLTSASGLSGAFGQAAYATTKMGVIGLTRSVAWEGTRFGVKANALAPAAFDTRLFSVFTPDGDAALRGRPPELEISLDSAEYVALLTASRVTPMALALVHQSCPATAQIFGATGGYYCRYAISHTEGATFGPHPTVEDIAGNWERIRDGSLHNELDGEAMAWGVKAYSTRLQDLAAQLQDAESTNV
ncbi:SDR family NAD(P)-dependent oxidoreductase [Mycobacterium sp.]|uniref:SDR family NAD(P)-dependent oxidoreductase n=1 Tax=Mycobacterium sp. TaxID=1785 RepID=UPI002D8474F5|nr:SDR family NAD(P)-dependent oxidoreductase [Mycobacterium sp.]